MKENNTTEGFATELEYLKSRVRELESTEKALRENEALYSALFLNNPIQTVVVDLTGRIIAFNKQKVISGDRVPVIGKIMYKDYAAKHNIDMYSELMNCINSGEMREYPELKYKEKILNIKIAPFENGAIITSIDITEHKRIEEESKKMLLRVQTAQKLESLGILAGGIAHDFNNLLLGIIGNADLALLEIPSASPARRNIMDIITISRRSADLCRQMLAYSGKGKFIKESLNLSQLVMEIGSLLEVSISKTARLRYSLAENINLFDGDATQIRQVIMNLLTNASDAIGDREGLISISTGVMECDREYLSKTCFKDEIKKGIYVYLEVSDTGCGMDRKTQERIFEPFYSTKRSGRGLGLAAVMGIIRSHEGACILTSEPGEGSTFKILFPVSGKHSIKMPEKAVKTWKPSGKVLLLDDDETALSVAGKMLDEIGFDVITGKDDMNLSGILNENSEDIKLILMDIDMPGTGGERVIDRVRELNDIPVIIFSGSISEEQNKFKGFAGVIQKPFSLEVLKQKIMEVIGKAC